MSVANENPEAQVSDELFSKEEANQWQKMFADAGAVGNAQERGARIGQAQDALLESLGNKFAGENLSLDECEALFNDAVKGEGMAEGSPTEDRAIMAGIMLGAAKNIIRKKDIAGEEGRLARMEQAYAPLKKALPKKFSATRFETFWRARQEGYRAARSNQLPTAGFEGLNRMAFSLGRYIRLKFLDQKDPTMKESLERTAEAMKKKGRFPGAAPTPEEGEVDQTVNKEGELPSPDQHTVQQDEQPDVSRQHRTAAL